MRFLVLCFLLVSVLSCVLAGPHSAPDSSVRHVRGATSDCEDKNEVYLYCGSACPARCGDKPGGRPCTMNCVKGCFCKKGYVLNTHNKCVKPEKC